MKSLLILFLVFILVAGCAREENEGSRLYISGDSQSVGADVYVDGQKIGIMKKHVYSGPKPTEEEIKKQHEGQQRLGIEPTNPPEPGDVSAVCVDIRINNGEKKPEYGVYSGIRVPDGKHEIKFINKTGKILKKELNIQGENYIVVDFGKMTIK